jgi:hypothetical protein
MKHKFLSATICVTACLLTIAQASAVVKANPPAGPREPVVGGVGGAVVGHKYHRHERRPDDAAPIECHYSYVNGVRVCQKY